MYMQSEMKHNSVVYWFNPENDIALGMGARQGFTPPRQATTFARGAAAIMWWLGEGGDKVLMPNDLTGEERTAAEEWRSRMVALVGDGPELIYGVEGEVTQMEARPWGWSRYACTMLRNKGLEGEQLDRIETLAEELRQLSHRRTAVKINRRLTAMVDWAKYGLAAPEAAVELRSAEEVRARLEKSNARGEVTVWKSPWSSSGRGVFFSDKLTAEVVVNRCATIIRQQGSVMVERARRKLIDFAMLFRAEGSEVRLWGLSEFHNLHGSAYGGNRIASDEAILAHLTAHLPKELFAEVSDALSALLAELVGDKYEGFMGVDMMVVEGADGGAELVPCVELNLRCTMGVVARRVYDRLTRAGVLLPDGEGTMEIIPGHMERPGIMMVPETANFSIVTELAQPLTNW